MFDSKSDTKLFAKPFSLFAREDGSRASEGTVVNLGPSGPVAPEDLVGPDGRCAPAAAPQASAAQPAPSAAEPPPAANPADRRVGSLAGDLAGPPMPPGAAPQGPDATGDAGIQTLPGGISLAMTECDVVRRAGLASNVSIGVGDHNDRKVVLTYLGGTWPGIYTFSGGRLKEISRAPEQAKPAKATPRKKPRKPAKRS
ncbi:MAG: hypothetical protein GC182_09760 [Rhodopseudomonas sp.]|nr:hypothetical protein [Rhodopseudomonas sp.]